MIEVVVDKSVLGVDNFVIGKICKESVDFGTSIKSAPSKLPFLSTEITNNI